MGTDHLIGAGVAHEHTGIIASTGRACIRILEAIVIDFGLNKASAGKTEGSKSTEDDERSKSTHAHTLAGREPHAPHGMTVVSWNLRA